MADDVKTSDEIELEAIEKAISKRSRIIRSLIADHFVVLAIALKYFRVASH